MRMLGSRSFWHVLQQGIWKDDWGEQQALIARCLTAAVQNCWVLVVLVLPNGCSLHAVVL